MAEVSKISNEWVTGQFVLKTNDGPDPDSDPDVEAAQGRINFVASIPYQPIPVGEVNPVTELLENRYGVLDAEGYLCTPIRGTDEPAYRGVRLEVTDDIDGLVRDWTWNATYQLTNTKQSIPAHNFTLLPGAPIDLTTVLKVPSSTGIGTEQAEALVAAAAASAISAASSSERAELAAERAANAAEATDGGVSNLVDDPVSLTGMSVRTVAELVAEGKLDVAEAEATYQRIENFDTTGAANIAAPGTQMRAAVEALAGDAASGRIPATEKASANGVATLDAESKIPTSQVPDALKPRTNVKPVGQDELVVNVRDYGAKGDYDPATKTGTDDTAAFAAAITSNRIVYIPSGDYKVDTIRLDGAAGTFRRVALIGAGEGITILHQPAEARTMVPATGDGTQSPNVVEARSGGSFVLRDLTIIGNAKQGGSKPLRAMEWLPGTLYTYSAATPVYKATKANGDATLSTDKAPDVKVWKLAATHTSNAGTNITTDADTGKWMPVPNFEALNYYWYGESFNRNHGVSFTADKGLPRIEGVTMENVEVLDCAYASILIGSGAVIHPDYVTSGVNKIKITNCSTAGSAAGVGGGNKSNMILSNSHISASSNVINCDEGSEYVTITGNIIAGDGPGGTAGNGVSSYQSSYINVSGNEIIGCTQGVNFQDTGGTSVKSSAVSGNTIIGGGTAISINGDNNAAVSGNTIHSPSGNGIKITDSYNVTATGNTVLDSATYGIQLVGGHGNTLVGNAVTRAQKDGFYLHGTKTATITANNSEGNNVSDTPDCAAFRVRGDLASGVSADLVFVGNTAADYGSPRKQRYGLSLSAGVSACLVQGNNFNGALTAAILNNGNANTIGFNKSTTTAFRSAVGILPDVDNSLTLGTATSRWSEMFSLKYSGYDGTRSLKWTNGSPNGTLVGSPGDMVLNIAGGAGVTLWIKETGIATNTGWVGK